MYAVIETGGKQYLVKPGQSLRIEKVAGDKGETVVFDQVLLTANDDGTNVKIGMPFLSGVSVTGTVELQGKTKTLRVIKFKRKVRYRRANGHRQRFTKVKIETVK